MFLQILKEIREYFSQGEGQCLVNGLVCIAKVIEC